MKRQIVLENGTKVKTSDDRIGTIIGNKCYDGFGVIEWPAGMELSEYQVMKQGYWIHHIVDLGTFITEYHVDQLEVLE